MNDHYLDAFRYADLENKKGVKKLNKWIEALAGVIGGVVLLIIVICLAPVVLMLLWNNFVIDILPVKSVNFFQACALIAVSYILIKPAK